MTKYLLISGSPRKGNTDFVLSKVYESLNEKKELIFLRDLNFSHCKGCLTCYSTGACVIKDDMEQLFSSLLSADMIIIGSPLYYGNVSGLMKQFIDRTIPAYESKSLKDKQLLSIMVGGGKVQVTEKFHREAIKGFVKYNRLDLIETYNFEAFEADDLKQDVQSKMQISEIVRKINSCP
ncbi:hypothetical protein GQ472_03660 [archaeon]|nr:hypothetical protein [archaeon]